MNEAVVTFPGDPRPRSGADGAVLVKPRQGFTSLHRSLWNPYSLGRRLGLSDLGTYNPSSTLPGGGKSDHAYSPAWAFDLGLTKVGTRLRARYFFARMVGRPDVEYVIFEEKIWSQSHGMRPYTAGGHGTHVHVSGRRPR